MHEYDGLTRPALEKSHGIAVDVNCFDTGGKVHGAAAAVCHAERSTSITSKIGIIVPPVARISFLWLTVSEPLAAILEFDLLLRIKAHFTLQETKKPAHHRLKIAGAAGSELSISYPPLRNASGSFVWPQIMSEACSIDRGGLLLRHRYHTHGVRQDLLYFRLELN